MQASLKHNRNYQIVNKTSKIEKKTYPEYSNFKVVESYLTARKNSENTRAKMKYSMYG